MRISKLVLALFLSAASVPMLAQSQTVTFFAHRASRFEFDENTLPAFKACYEKGMRGYETDIRMTKDGQLVVNHDETFTRLTGCEGKVESMTAAEIRELKTLQGNKILFLDELMKFLDTKDGLYVEFEMKTSSASSYPTERLREYCDKLYKMVMANKPANSIYLFTSSSKTALNMMRSLHPDVDMLMIFSKPVCDETIAEAEAMGIKRIGCNVNGTTRSAVKKAKEAGLSVSLWPSRTPEDIMLGVYLGAEFLCCDRAIEVKKFLDEKATWVKYK